MKTIIRDFWDKYVENNDLLVREAKVNVIALEKAIVEIVERDNNFADRLRGGLESVKEYLRSQMSHKDYKQCMLCKDTLNHLEALTSTKTDK